MGAMSRNPTKPESEQPSVRRKTKGDVTSPLRQVTSSCDPKDVIFRGTNGFHTSSEVVRTYSTRTNMKLQNFMDEALSSTPSAETSPSEVFRVSPMEMTFGRLCDRPNETILNKKSEKIITDGGNVAFKDKIKSNLHLELSTNSSSDIIDSELEIKMAPNPRSEEISELQSANGSDASSDYNMSEAEDELYGVRKSKDGGQRTISEIKVSLEKGVKRLREEKGVLERKLQISREGESICTQEKAKHDVPSRIARLKRIISELRRKLEDQGKRLQSNYNTILAIQRNVLRCRSFTMKRKFVTDSVIRESPF